MPEHPDQKDYWNANLDPQNLADREDGITSFNYSHERTFYLTPDQRHALEIFGTIRGKVLLDIGAGIGTNSLYMANSDARVIAIDLAHERLKTLRSLGERFVPNNGSIMLVKCSAEALPFQEATIDLACSKSVLIHTNLATTVSEIKRVMKPGGHGIFIEPLKRNPFVNAYRNTLAPQIWKQITTYFGDTELGHFRTAFPESRIDYYYYFSFFAFVFQFAVRAPALFRVILPLLHQMDKLLFTAIPPLRKYAWFALISCRRNGD